MGSLGQMSDLVVVLSTWLLFPSVPYPNFKTRDPVKRSILVIGRVTSPWSLLLLSLPLPSLALPTVVPVVDPIRDWVRGPGVLLYRAPCSPEPLT